VNRTEIQTAAEQHDRAVIERASLAGNLGGAELAPAADSGAALDAFRALVTEAARDALAGVDTRPVVHLHQHTHYHAAPAPAPVAAPVAAPVGVFGGRYPSPAEAAFIVPMAPLRRPVPVRHWGKAVALSSAGVAVAGAASGIVVGTAVGPVGMVVGGIVGAVVGTARALSEQDQENGR
jgi:hypothetical protein